MNLEKIKLDFNSRNGRINPTTTTTTKINTILIKEIRMIVKFDQKKFECFGAFFPVILALIRLTYLSNVKRQTKKTQVLKQLLKYVEFIRLNTRLSTEI